MININQMLKMSKLISFFVFVLLILVGTSLSAQKHQYKIAAIGFYNLENLFDTIDTENVLDTEFSPQGAKVWDGTKYHKKIDNMASVISELATEKCKEGISILGVSEIENRSVLEDLVVHPLLAERNYQIVHYDSPDRRGVDVGLIYQPDHFVVLKSRPIPLLLYESDDTSRIYTRDILYVEGLFDGELMSVLVNHWPSRRGGEMRSGRLRAKAAGLCRTIVDSLINANPNHKIVIMGDLNDDPNSNSLKKTLRAKSSTKELKKDSDLFNLMYDHYKKGIGSNAYRDAWSLFDQIIVSKNLTDKGQSGYFVFKPTIHNDKKLIQTSGNFKNYPLRTFSGDEFLAGYSDHFPVFTYLLKAIN